YSEPRVRLEPAVAEEWVRRVGIAGHSPNEFAPWVLSTVDLDEMLRHFADSEGAAPAEEPERTRPSPHSPPMAASRVLRDAASSTEISGGWTKETFFAFLDLVSSVDDMAGSVRLLGAYLRLGPIPSSQDLKAICGFEDEGEWQTALRVAKQ